MLGGQAACAAWRSHPTRRAVARRARARPRVAHWRSRQRSHSHRIRSGFWRPNDACRSRAAGVERAEECTPRPGRPVPARTTSAACALAGPCRRLCRRWVDGRDVAPLPRAISRAVGGCDRLDDPLSNRCPRRHTAATTPRSPGPSTTSGTPGATWGSRPRPASGTSGRCASFSPTSQAGTQMSPSSRAIFGVSPPT